MKKVLSLVLSLCLFVSLGAGISFDTADAAFQLGAYDLYWDFMKTCAANTSIEAGANLNYDTTSTGGASEVNTNVKSEPYAFFGYSETNAGNYAMYSSTGYGILMFTAARAQTTTLGIKLWANRTGKYVPMLNVHGFGDYVNATTYDFYIIPLTGTETALGDIDLSKAVAHKTINFGAYATYDEFVALSDTPIDVTTGKEYLLVARSHNGGKGSFCFDGVLFKEANAADLTAIKLNLGNDERYYEVKVGEKISIPISLSNAAGGKVDLANTNGWSDSGDTDCVGWRLAKETNTVDITGMAVTAKPETHWIRYGNVVAYFNVKVNPADYEPADRDLTYDWYKAFTEGATFGGDSEYPETVTLGMMTVGAHNEINRWTGTANHNPDTTSRNSSSIYSDPIGFYQKDATALGVMTYHNFAMYHGGTGNYDFIIKVPFDGYFLPKVVLTTEARVNDYKAGSQHNVSIMSLDESKTYGTVTISKGAAGTIAAASGIKLEKGDYILRLSQGTAGTNFFNGLILEYMSGLSYDVTLNLNGGTASEGIASYTHGVAATLPTASKEGYTFAGWYDAAGNKVTAIPATARGDKAYTAKFTYIPKTYNVTLNANGGTVAADLTSYTEGTAATLPAATKTGYVFAGWYDNADLIGTAVTAIDAAATGDKTFWAKWTLDVSASDFTVTASSGYYAYYVSNPNREGVIAITAAFAKYATTPIEKAGIMIYVAGNEDNEAKIARVEANTLATATFSAIFNGIAKENFDKEVLAKAYVVVDGDYIYSDAITTSVDGSRWVGVKPE